MNKKYSIKLVYTSIILIGSFILVGVFSYIWVKQQNNFLSYQILEFKKRLILSENNLIKQEVENTVSNIRYKNQIARKLLKRELTKRIERAGLVVSSLVKKYKNKITDDELKELIKTSLRDVRFNDGGEYFFIVNMDGTEILYPIKPEYENKNIINLQDNKGNFVIKDEIELLKKKKDDFVTAYWTKDKNDKKQYLKISYIKRLDVFNWYIGTGAYLDDFKENLKKDTLLKLSKKKFSKYGYIYVNTYDGHSLLLNGEVNKKPINFINNRDIKGNFTTQLQINMVKTNGSGFINYYWHKIGEKKPIKKTAFVKGMDDWKWIVGTGYYHDEINGVISKAKKEFSNKFYNELAVFTFIILFLILLLFVFIYILNKFLSKDFKLFIKSFENASLNNELIKEDNIKFNEFLELVQNTNIIIKEKQVLESEIFQKRRLESLGVLAGGIAHDFNNLLTAILANINYAKNLNNLDEIIEVLSDAETASDRAKGLALQLLTFSKGGKPVLETISLTNLIKETSLFLLSGTSIGFKYKSDDDLWLIDADKNQIGQVIENIIINAKQAMGLKGEIKIKLSNENKKLNKFVKIEISDNGSGVKKEIINKIFDPYFTTKESGHGLGLASTYSIIKKHHGYIEVESKVNKGTIFTIYLPVTKEALIKKNKENVLKKVKENFVTTINKNHKKGRKERILILDDEEIILNVSKKLFQHLGYIVTTVKTGEELLLKYKEKMEIKTKYDIVIMDLTIHGGMGGEEAIKELLKIDNESVVIVSSGYSNSPVMANYETYGFKGALAKPYKLDDIRDVLNTIL